MPAAQAQAGRGATGPNYGSRTRATCLWLTASSASACLAASHGMNKAASWFPSGERDVGTNVFLGLRVLLQSFCKPLEPFAERGDAQSVPF